jgi:c-di-GMP-binding flagellar brake protein YcgR
MKTILPLVVAALVVAGMYCIQKYRRKKEEKRTEHAAGIKLLPAFDVTDDPGHIEALLKAAQQHHALLRVRLNNRGTVFNSTILEVAKDSVLIDALYPQEGNALIADARFVSLEIIIKQITAVPFQCSAGFTAHASSRGLPALRLSLPDTITRNQKRNYHRVDLLPEDNIHVSFTVAGTAVHDPVANISGAGIGFYSNHESTLLHHGRTIEQVTIAMPEPTVVESITILYKVNQLRYPVLIRDTVYHYYYGAEFTGIRNETREKIIQYGIEKEREALQRTYPLL